MENKKVIMEIIYRLNEIVENEYVDYDGTKKLVKETFMLDQNICCCNSREHFKEIMRDMYSPKKIHFANSKKLNVGDIFITIISEDCYNTEQYFIINEYKCDCCGKTFKANEKLLKRFWSYWEFKSACKEKYNEDKEKIKNMVFCCLGCELKKKDEIIKEYNNFAKENNLINDNDYITREHFSKDYGYIYMITKKSTNEFYVGKTIYAPVFRWGQHLTTERFKIDNIIDYKFEVLEVVKRDNTKTTLSDRETYWINKKRNENPTLSLNILIPKEKDELK